MSCETKPAEAQQQDLDEFRRSIVAQLKEASKCVNIEYAHMDADDLLVEFVRFLGFDDVADAFEEVEKWYA